MTTRILRTPSASRRALRGAAFAAALLVASTARAETPEWTWSVAPYAWATDIGIDVTLDGRQVVDREIAISDLLEDLETVAQVHVEAQRGAHGVMFDLFDVRLADEARVAFPGGEAALDARIGMTLVEAGGIYDPRGDQRGFALLYGARILDQRAEIDADFDLAGGAAARRGYDSGETLVDGLIGLRYVGRLSPRWTWIARADLSAGGTDLTWSAGSALSYSFGRDGRYAATAGYRHMAVELPGDDSLATTLTLSGFVAGLRTSF